jgi:polysaccharide deacetylase family protein (PEP-CTERM system associated)
MLNIISVDVEEYFHPSEVARFAPMDQWETLPSRVEEPTRRILHLFSQHGTHGTFFILGWVAERYPHLVREIAAAGHEIACHSYAHRLIYDLTPAEFAADTKRAVAAIEDACGISPRAYRAPSYSLVTRSMWALEILIQCGFTHDSSIYPISHDRYGIPGFGSNARTLRTPSGPILEVPIAAVKLSGRRVAPVGGGAYLRLLPYRYSAAGIRRLNYEEDQPACIYLHPWEIDPDIPQLAQGWISRLRTYGGLSSMEGKLERLMSEFSFSTLGEVHPVPEPSASRSAVSPD